MSDKEPKIVNPELSINKKLGTKKFDQVFDSATIKKAEKTVEQSKEVFKSETSSDYENLKDTFKNIDEKDLDNDAYKKLAELAFSIKSRATTGGMPLASDVANSMYKFCDAAAQNLPTNVYQVIKLYMDALSEVFENNFDSNDEATKQRLVNGLEEVSKKFMGKA